MITIDMGMAKDIGHNIRRQLRAAEFEPLDQVIAAQIPGSDFVAVEAERQAIRDKYALAQAQIDAASTPEQIKEALGL